MPVQLLSRTFDRPGSTGLSPALADLHQQCRERVRAAVMPRPIAARRTRATSLTSTAIVGLAAPSLKLRSDEAAAGSYKVFAKFAFAASIASGRPIRALMDHNPADLVATTDDRLSLIEDDAGLWFRLALRDTDIDREALALVKNGRCGVSPGWNYKETEERTVAGERVTYIITAELSEISLVESPAFVETAAWLDTTGRSLRTMIRDGAMTQRAGYDSTAAQFRRSLQTLAGSLARAGR